MTEESPTSKRVVVNKEARKIVIQRKQPLPDAGETESKGNNNQQENIFAKEIILPPEVASVVHTSEKPVEQKKLNEIVQDSELAEKPTVEKKLTALERLKALNFAAPKSSVNPFSSTAPKIATPSVSISSTKSTFQEKKSVNRFVSTENNRTGNNAFSKPSVSHSTTTTTYSAANESNFAKKPAADFSYERKSTPEEPYFSRKKSPEEDPYFSRNKCPEEPYISRRKSPEEPYFSRNKSPEPYFPRNRQSPDPYFSRKPAESRRNLNFSDRNKYRSTRMGQQRSESKPYFRQEPIDNNKPMSLMDLLDIEPPSLIHQQQQHQQNQQNNEMFSNFPSSSVGAVDFTRSVQTNLRGNPANQQDFNLDAMRNSNFLSDFSVVPTAVISRLPTPPPPIQPLPPPPMFNVPNLSNVGFLRFNNGALPPVPAPPTMLPPPVIEDRLRFIPPPPPNFVPPPMGLENNEIWPIANMAILIRDSLEREKLAKFEVTDADINSLSLNGLKRTCEYLLEVQSELLTHSQRLCCQMKIVQRALDCAPPLPTDFAERLKLQNTYNATQNVRKRKSAKKTDVAAFNDETFTKTLFKAISDKAEERKKAMNFGHQQPTSSQRKELDSAASGEYDYMSLSKMFFAGMAAGVTEHLKVPKPVESNI